MASRRRSRIEGPGHGGMPLADLRERPAPPFPWLRAVGIAMLIVGGLAGAAVGGIRALIDTEAMKADAQATLRRMTGREVVIAGPLTIQSYFGAIVAVDDVQVPNRPGAAQPLMARIGRLEAELSLMSLLGGTVEVHRLIMVQPDILLEVDADGRGNWQNPPGSPPPPGSEAGGTFRSWPRNLHLKEGRLTVADARTGNTTVLALRRISASETDTGGQLGLSADLALGTQRIAMTGLVGSLARLLDRSAPSPWPVRLTLETLGSRLAVAGSFRQPLDLEGYALKVDASVADSSALLPLIPVKLPAMRTVVASARIASTESGLPDISALRLQMGASDLGLWVPGLKVDAMEVSMPAVDQPMRGDFLGTLNGVPVRVQAALGAIGLFLPGTPARTGPFPVDVTADFGESRLHVKGAIGQPATRSGLDLAVALRVRELDLLSPIVGRRLPPMRSVSFDARLADGEGGFAQGLAFRDVVFAIPQGDLSGEMDLRFGARPMLRGRLKGERLDADALEPVVSAVVGPLSPFESAASLRPKAWNDRRLIPDLKLHLAALDVADIDLTLLLGAFRLFATDYREVSARLQVADGRMLLDPVTATVPAGRASLRLSADGRDAKYPVELALAVPGIPVQPLLAWSGQRDNLFGAVELDASLRAEGDTLRALAATVSGHVAAVIVEGDVDARLLLDPLTGVMAAARVPLNLATQSGMLSRLRCLATRLEADRGKVAVATMAADAVRMQFTGEGGFDLGQETYALRLVPAVQSSAWTLAVPLKLEGSFATPRLSLERPEQPAPAGATRAPAGPPPAAVRMDGLPDICTPALEAARGGRAGTMPGDRDARPSMVRPGPPRPPR